MQTYEFVLCADVDGKIVDVKIPKYNLAQAGEAKKAELLEHIESIHELLTLLGVPRGDELGAWSMAYRVAWLGGRVESEPQGPQP